MRSLLLAYAVLAAFVGLERQLRRDAAAQSLEAGAADRGTTRLIGTVYALALTAGLVAPLLSRRQIGRLPHPGLSRLEDRHARIAGHILGAAIPGPAIDYTAKASVTVL